MKKLMLTLAALAVAGAVALAGQVYDRQAITITNTGTADWENEVPYAAIKLVRVWQLSSLATSNNLTIVRVTADGLYTQTVGSITGPAPASTATFTAGYLSPGDILRVTSTPATGGVVQVEYEVQKH
jgi:hypothetical protein